MANRSNHERAADGASPYNRSDADPSSSKPSAELHDVTPTTVNQIVVGIFDRQEQAEEAINQLEREGFSRDDISLIMQPPGTRTEAGAGKTKAHEGTVAGVSAGAVLGGVAGLAALAIPGVGALLAAGPIAAALGAMGGAALGGLVGSFTGLGIPSEEAKQFDEAVRDGQVVLAVRIVDRSAEARAQAIIGHYQPRSVGSYSQTP
jgi:uncharacterized membrane protein